MCEKKYYVLDRVEGEWGILISEEEESVRVPRKLMSEAVDGDVMYEAGGRWQRDMVKTAELRARAAKGWQRLKEGGKGLK